MIKGISLLRFVNNIQEHASSNGDDKTLYAVSLCELAVKMAIEKVEAMGTHDGGPYNQTVKKGEVLRLLRGDPQ